MNTYDVLAKFYDHYSLKDEYITFMNQYMTIATQNGFNGNKVLDIGCGTGASMAPLLAQGYEVDGVELSKEMIDKAKIKLSGYKTTLYHQDICQLMLEESLKDSYELVVAVDDVLNHIIDIEALANCMKGVVVVLKKGGLFLFDVNTSSTFKSFFDATSISEQEDITIVSRSKYIDDLGIARILAFIKDGDLYHKEETELMERYYSVETLKGLLEENSLALKAVYGYKNKDFHKTYDDDEDLKLLFVAEKL